MIDFAAVDAALISAQPVLAVTLYPAAGLLAAVFGSELHRLGSDTQHDVSDYQPPAEPVVRRRLRPGSNAPSRRDWAFLDRRRFDTPATLRQPYAASVVSMVARKYGDSPEEIAARWLAEIGAGARAGLAVAR